MSAVLRALRRGAAAAVGAAIVLSVLGGGACGSGSGPRERGEPDAGLRHEELYEWLQRNAEHFTFVEGDWQEDYGDAPFYGLAFYSHAGTETGNRAWLDRAEAARARALGLIESPDLLAGDLNEMAMSALGLIEWMDARDDRSDLPVLDAFLDQVDAAVAALGWYLDPGTVSSWALATYGPTSVSGLVGLLNLQRAYVLGGESRAKYVDWAKQLEQHVSERAWSGSRYEFGAGREGLFLYPNVTMILFNARLYQLTGQERYRERALAAYEAIGPLELEAGGGGAVRYRSPYSAEAMGARTEDYSTLSSQNYLLFALLLLHQITGETAYLEEMDSVVEALSRDFRGPWCLSHKHAQPCSPECRPAEVCLSESCRPDECHDGVLHHWMDGRLALPEDPEYFCSGCNLQLLYVMWYRRHRL